MPWWSWKREAAALERTLCKEQAVTVQVGGPNVVGEVGFDNSSCKLSQSPQTFRALPGESNIKERVTHDQLRSKVADQRRCEWTHRSASWQSDRS